MRRFLVALLLLAPFAGATPPTPPWEFAGSHVSGSGVVGEPIRLEVRVKANTDLDARIVLATPDWVLAEGGTWHAEAAAGNEARHTWTLTPTREGPWAAIAREETQGFGAACACAMGYAGAPEEATVATTVDEAMPAVKLDRGLTTSGEDEAAPTIERTVIPEASWMGRAEIRVWITQGSTWLCDSCATTVPTPGHEATGPGSAPVSARATLPLRDGDAYTLWDEVVLRYETPPDATLDPQHRKLTGCENRRWNTTESWSCHEASREWRHMMPVGERLRHSIPAPLALPALLTLGGVALLCRRAAP